jgi:hypothetical protein
MYSKGPGLGIIGVLPILQSSIPLSLYNTRCRTFYFCSAVRSHRVFLITISSASSSRLKYVYYFLYGTAIWPSETLSRSGINNKQQKKDQRHFFHVHFVYMNVTPSLVGSMRLRLFSMYKRLKCFMSSSTYSSSKKRKQKRSARWGKRKRKNKKKREIHSAKKALSSRLF